MTPRFKRLLEPIIRVLERTPRSRLRASRAFALYYRARGADRVIVDDALKQGGALPLAATRSTMRWAAALAGGASMPQKFRPDRRLQTQAARDVALDLLAARIEADDDPEYRRQRSYLMSENGPDDPRLQEFVRDALERSLSSRTPTSPVGEALEPKAGFELLCILADALEGEGMRPFLVSGTLLGSVRDGALLEHDYDIDVGLLPGDGTAAGVGEVLGSIGGLECTVEEWRVWGRHRNGVAFDVFVHYEDRGRFYHATRTHAWWNTPFELARAELSGRKFWIPADTDTYLSENYGEWGAPIVFYDKIFDTPNSEYRDTAEALLYLYERIEAAIKCDDRFACESAVRDLALNFGIDLRHHFGASALLDPRE